jgi:hypothetical protein
MDLDEGDVSMDPVEPVRWVNEALDADRDNNGHSGCFMCEHGQDEGNGVVCRLQQVLNRQGEISDGARFHFAGIVQHQLQVGVVKTAIECADELLAHERGHVLETTTINSENLNGLRIVARLLRGQLQRRNLDTNETEVDSKRLATYMKVVKLQMDILKFKPEGLPFTKRRRVGQS